VEAGLIHPSNQRHSASVSSEKQHKAHSARYSTATHRKAQEAHDSEGHSAHEHMPPFRRFLKLLKPEKSEIVTLLIFAIFSGMLYLALPLAVDTIVTNLAFGNQEGVFVQALLVVAQILLLFLTLQALITWFQVHIAEVIQKRILVRTAADVAYRLPRIKAKAFDGVHGPELVNRFLDVVTVQKNTAFFLLDGINAVVSTVVGMFLLALFHPFLLGFVLILVTILIFGTLLLGKGAVTTAIDESRSKYDLVGWFEEMAAFPFMFKGPGGQDMAYMRTNELATEYVRARSGHFAVVRRQVIGLLVLSVVASVALLILATWLVLSQQITLGQLVASEIIMSSITASLMKLGKKYETWYDTMAATDKLGHLFDLETETSTGEEPDDIDHEKGMMVEADGVSFGYTSGKMLFENRDFQIKPGERTALQGPQGSGVSSMLDLLFALRHPTKGHISYDGLDSRDWPLDKLRGYILLLRRDEFIDGTIIENLRLGRVDIGVDEVRQALHQVGILDEIMKLPDGLRLRLRVEGAPLSTTQRIRLLFARAIVQSPRLLLIDELFDGLDNTTYEHLSNLVIKGDLPWTVVVSTRMRSMIQKCDWCISLRSEEEKRMDPAMVSTARIDVPAEISGQNIDYQP